MNKRKIQYWVIPPKSDVEFVASMEDILDIYSIPYNKSTPVLCMDEQPFQLLKETRISIPANRKHAKRVDYEYERAGTASIFMFTEPLSGWRQVRVRPKRKKIDWACEVERLLRTDYANIEKIILICDNLNTHTKGAFYKAFSPEKAREIVKRIEFHYTPKHGSWLNVAENELSAMTRQCLKYRYIGDISTLQNEVKAWAIKRNEKQKGVDWQFTINDARGKLKSVYPKIINEEK